MKTSSLGFLIEKSTLINVSIAMNRKCKNLYLGKSHTIFFSNRLNPSTKVVVRMISRLRGFQSLLSILVKLKTWVYLSISFLQDWRWASTSNQNSCYKTECWYIERLVLLYESSGEWGGQAIVELGRMSHHRAAFLSILLE